MTEFAEFLLARIAEDEAVAQASFQQVGDREVGGWYWSNAGDAVFLDDTPEPVACGPWQRLMHQPSARHIARWDPERVVAECDAKRRIIQRAAASAEHMDDTLRLLGLPYADHRDYRAEWRPQPSTT